MSLIDLVYLAENNAKGWRILDDSRTLPESPDLSIELPVSDGSTTWAFECQSLGNNRYYISGRVWDRFFSEAGSGARVMLYSREEGEDFHRIEVVRSD